MVVERARFYRPLSAGIADTGPVSAYPAVRKLRTCFLVRCPETDSHCTPLAFALLYEDS
jgi:hypothetical protein